MHSGRNRRSGSSCPGSTSGPDTAVGAAKAEQRVLLLELLQKFGVGAARTGHMQGRKIRWLAPMLSTPCPGDHPISRHEADALAARSPAAGEGPRIRTRDRARSGKGRRLDRRRRRRAAGPRERGAKVRMIALGEAAVQATIAPIAQRELAERAIARVVGHRSPPVLDSGNGSDCRRWLQDGLPRRPRPEAIGPGNDVEDPVEGQLTRLPAGGVMRIGGEQGVGGVRRAVAKIPVNGVDDRGVNRW